ncbi:MAG: excinuclease ABC subunit UvrA [Bacteroidaceae bacterium]|nr:excinuclease ABC subunit UvrA [Bacteroidaceae bacterium]MBQ8270509.1 excinuclease ABC subunit UvrA [Bacteroidaceae bacterium]
MKEKRNNIEVYGARVHNLKNIDVSIPHNSLTVITGLSGSGKSSLAFDTVFAEGQRRYLETFSTYARNFLGGMERPDVDKITGLGPVISIEQKTTNKNPRSTVGTTTEIYDYMRLLFSRVGEAYSYLSGEKMVKYTEEQILSLVMSEYSGKRIYMLAPLVKSRKGHYKELFEQMMRKGYLNVRVDGEMCEMSHGMKLERYKNHDIEVVVDKLVVDESDMDRIKQSLSTTMHQGDGLVMIMEMPSGNIRHYSKRLMCPVTGLSYKEPDPHNFSFNSPQGFCPKCKGLGVVSMVDVDKVIPDRSLSVYDGALAPLGKYRRSSIFQQIEAVLARYDADLKTAVSELPDEAIDEILYGSPVPLRLNGSSEMFYDSFATYNGLIKYIQMQKETGVSAKEQRWAEQFSVMQTCPECGGSRLNKEALHYKLNGKNIAELSSMDIALLYDWLCGLEEHLTERQRAIAHEMIKEITTRLRFLLDVGLGYLSLSRSSASLSGGEGQRIRLATQVGSQLVNVFYILDEPSIGLHSRDNDRLIKSLKSLRDSGNTVIVVEHDRDIMLSSDYVIDLGPKAGRKGGNVVFAGTPREMLDSNTLTANYLKDIEVIPVPSQRRAGNGKSIKIFGACGNNLKNIDVEFPLGKLICVTGVSGGGKSSLVNDTLQPILAKHFYRALREPLPYKSIEGVEHIDKIVDVDQSPLGRTPRSNPATYTGVFSDIRNLFVGLPEAKIRGYKPGRFSFNVSGGRCDACSGNGYKTLEMNFLPDVMVPCEVCHGKRYNRETLEVRYKGKSIADVLDMTINMAVEFFENVPAILNKIKVLQDVGLGYIKLGQPSTTLSGGESQRVKLATELSKRDTGKTLYLLDEPTTGLHFEDIRVLMNVINRLVDKGNTVVIIEHNLDVIKTADYIIDMGPEGGRDGGVVVASGTPEEVASGGIGYTAPYLAKELQR